MLRRYATVAAALATAVLAVLVPTAGTAAPALDRREIITELKAAYAEELRAWGLLSKSPPRFDTARIFLRRSDARLGEILSDPSLSPSLRTAVDRASLLDLLARSTGTGPARDSVESGAAKDYIEKALRAKAQALGTLLPQPGQGAPQCADGRDNDGDKTADAVYDSGCANPQDSSEGSPLTCRLVFTPGGGGYVVGGTCSGPFFKVEIIAPQGAKLDTKQDPIFGYHRACGHVGPEGDGGIDCLMSDGVANPGHVIRVRWSGKTPQAARSLKVRVTDFAGRSRTWKPSQKPAPPPAEPAFSLGPEPVPGVITFTNGTGGCPVVLSFVVPNAQFFAPGDGTLTITTGKDQVTKGPIKRDGSFDVRSANESYKGKITGNTATGTYTYTTPSSCIESYDVKVSFRR